MSGKQELLNLAAPHTFRPCRTLTAAAVLQFEYYSSLDRAANLTYALLNRQCSEGSFLPTLSLTHLASRESAMNLPGG